MKYELIQRGIVVASVQGDDENQVKSWIMHYALMYSQDGPCLIKGPLPDDEFDEDELHA